MLKILLGCVRSSNVPDNGLKGDNKKGECTIGGSASGKASGEVEDEGRGPCLGLMDRSREAGDCIPFPLGRLWGKEQQNDTPIVVLKV